MFARILMLAATISVGGCSEPARAPGIPRAPTVERYDISIPAFGGELLGRDDGEWGGRLSFRGASGEVTRLLDKNVIGLHRMPYGIVAVTGLAHLGSNEGELFLITRLSPTRLRVNLLRTLRYAPHGSRQRADGSVDIVLFTGNIENDRWMSECVSLGTDQSLKKIACPDDLPLKY